MTTVLLTGSTRGIGAATYAALTGAGATVIGHGSGGGGGSRGDDGHGRDGSAGDPIGVDLALAGAGDKLWDAALDRAGGRIDVLVNNAGVFEGVALDAADADWAAAWARSLSVNLQAAADLSRRAVLHFRERALGARSDGGRGAAAGISVGSRDAAGVGGWAASGVSGRIVNVASRAAFRGDSPAHWHYAAAKAGMVAMTRTIARAYAADGVLAFVVAPGFTMTGMAEDYLTSRGGDALLADIPLGRVASAAEVAETIRWLALDAPPSLTGAVLDVNGASYAR